MAAVMAMVSAARAAGTTGGRSTRTAGSAGRAGKCGRSGSIRGAAARSGAAGTVGEGILEYALQLGGLIGGQLAARYFALDQVGLDIAGRCAARSSALQRGVDVGQCRRQRALDELTAPELTSD
jgi:hypothetical protein